MVLDGLRALSRRSDFAPISYRPGIHVRPSYDKKHRFFGISSLPSKPSKLFQKGFREHLLCDNCEQQLGAHEDYASKVFFGDAATRPVRTKVGLIFSGFKYKPLKLFFMSLLWRFSVTSLQHYKGLELGPYREKLRKLIASNDPADRLTFPCMVTAVTFQGRHMPDMIVPPTRMRLEGRCVWTFVIAGFLFHFFVSKQPSPGIASGFLREDGTMLLGVSDIGEIRGLCDWMAKMATAERARADRKRFASGIIY